MNVCVMCVCMDINDVSAQVGHRNRHPGRHSLANSYTDIFTHTRCVHSLHWTESVLLSTHSESVVLPSGQLYAEINT